MMHEPRRYPVLLLAALMQVALSACGGGGDGGGSPAPTSIPSPLPTASTVPIEEQAGDGFDPRVVTDTAGNAMAVWVHDDGTGTGSVYAARYDAASDTWGAVVRIDDQAAQPLDADLAIDTNGNIIAVWCQSVGTNDSVYANRYDATAAQWGTPRRIGNTSGDAQRPQLAVDAAGNVMVVWQVYDSTSNAYSVYANRYDAAGGGWGNAGTIETATGGASNARLGVDAAGNAIAIWTQRVGRNEFVYANRYEAGTGWGATGRAIELDAGPVSGSTIALDSTGNAIAAWSKFDGTRHNISYNRYDAATQAWGATAPPIESETEDALYPTIAVDAAGNALVVWGQTDSAGSQWRIKASRYDATAQAWGTADALAAGAVGSTPSTDAPAFHLAAAPNGAAVLAWSFDADVSLQRYDVATGWSVAESIETNAGAADVPYVAVGRNNRTFVVWQQRDSAGVGDIWAYHGE